MTTASRNINPVFIVLLMILFALLAFCLFSCTERYCQKHYPPPEITKDSIAHDSVTTVRDSVIFISDSAGFRAFMECDSLGRIYLKRIEMYSGQMIHPNVILRDNYIIGECKIDSGKIATHWLTTYVKDFRNKSVVIVKMVKYQTWFQKFWGTSGKIAWSLLPLIIAYVILKIKGIIKF